MVPVALNVPVRMRVLRVVLLITADLDLLETPLRQDCVRSTKIATKRLVTETHASRERVHAVGLRPRFKVINDFDNPVVLLVADGRVAIARDFVVQLRDGRRDGVRVQVAGGRGVLEPDRVAVLEEAERAVRVVRSLIPAGHHNPLVVLVLVVVAGHLLLLGADRVGLDVGVQKTSTPAHVFEREFRAIRDIWGWEAKL